MKVRIVVFIFKFVYWQVSKGFIFIQELFEVCRLLLLSSNILNNNKVTISFNIENMKNYKFVNTKKIRLLFLDFSFKLNNVAHT